MDSKDFVAYWNYIPLVYFVKSYQAISILRDKFRDILGARNFLIAEISPFQMDGLLPRAAWDWFYHDHGQLSLPEVYQRTGESQYAGALGSTSLLGQEQKK
jgi:hypothetical protein